MTSHEQTRRSRRLRDWRYSLLWIVAVVFVYTVLLVVQEVTR